MNNLCISDLNTISTAKSYDCLETLSLQEQSKISGGYELVITSTPNGGTGVGIGFTIGSTAYGIGIGIAPASGIVVATASSPLDE
jgi:hypothetical protein